MNDILGYEPKISLGVNLMLRDIVFLYFTFICLLRIKIIKPFFFHNRNLRRLTYTLLYIIIAIPLFVLLKDNKLVASINNSREFILYLPAFLYFFSFKYSSLTIEKFIKNFTMVGIGVGIISIGIQLTTKERIMPPGGALFLAYCSIFILLKYYEKGRQKDLYIALILIFLVIMLRHRSVWIALIIGLLFAHYYVGNNKKIVFLVFTLFIALSMMTIIFPDKIEKLSEMLSESASPFKSVENFEDSTGGGRVSRWKSQIESKFSYDVIFWGLGHAYDRKTYFYTASGDKRLSTVSFHNHYLEQSFRVGMLSVLFLVLFIFRFLKLNHRWQYLNKNFYLIGISSCIAGTIVFGMIYNYTYTIFILMGTGYSILIKQNENY